MTRIKVKSLIWDNWNLEHIKKHRVGEKEVEIVVENLSYHKQTYNNRYLLVGRSGSRILSVVLKRQDKTTYYVVTARDASQKEKREVYEKEKIKQNS